MDKPNPIERKLSGLPKEIFAVVREFHEFGGITGEEMYFILGERGIESSVHQIQAHVTHMCSPRRDLLQKSEPVVIGKRPKSRGDDIVRYITLSERGETFDLDEDISLYREDWYIRTHREELKYEEENEEEDENYFL